MRVKHHQLRILLMYVLLFILFFSFNSLAQPPFQQTTIGNSVLEIDFPKFEFFKLGDSLQLNFHVFNNSGILVLNDTGSCVFHLFNFTAGHLIEELMIFSINDNDFFIDISTGNLSVVGVYPYLVRCNTTSGQGGFVSGVFEVTVDGLGDDSFNGWLPIILVFALASALSLFGSFLIRSRGLQGLRALLFLFGVVNGLLLWVLPYLISVNASRVSSFKPISVGMVGIALGLIFTVILFYALFLFDRATRTKERKEDD